MQTAINVVFSLFFICSLTILDVYCIFSILANSLSKLALSYSCEPKILPMLDIIVPNFYFNVSSLFKPFSITLGKFRNLKVWPVGAVSKTMTSKSIFYIELS